MEIRFRVWDGEKMWYPEDGYRQKENRNGGYFVKQDGIVYEGSEDEDFAIIGAGFPVCSFPSEDIAIPMLSTGYRDLKSNEIWVDDIYKHRILGLVKVNLPDFFQYNMVYPIFHDSIVVVGNIHENPELLEEVA